MQQDLRDGGRPAGGTASTGQLTAGASIGRFQIVELVHKDALGERYQATDTAAAQPVALRLLASELGSGSQAMAAEITLAQALEHKNISRTLGAERDGARIVVIREWVDGQTLAALIARKAQIQAGQGAFSLKAAFNVIAHVCNALAHAHQTTVHGALSTASVVVNPDGRVKVVDFGLGWAAAQLLRKGARGLGPIAPELAKSDPTRAADVYGVGAILYELLTGREPAGTVERPSRLVSSLPAAIDAVMARSLAPKPEQRFADVLELKQALSALVEAAPGAGGSSGSVSLNLRPDARPSAVPMGTQPGIERKLPPRPAAAMSFDDNHETAGFVRAALVAEDDQRFLVQKNKLDFGPYSIHELRELIDKGEVEGDHTMSDRDTGERSKVRKHPLLTEPVREAEAKFERLRRQQAEQVVVTREKRGGLALYGLFVVIAGVLGVGGWFAYKAIRGEKKQTVHLGQAELEVGSITAQAGDLPTGPTGGPPKKHHSGGGGGGGTAWDDEVDLGDASKGGGHETLPGSVIDGVLARHANSLASCVHGAVRISFQIFGTGKVGGVKVNGAESGGVASCIRPRLQGITFPSFNGARMAANFSMSVD